MYYTIFRNRSTLFQYNKFIMKTTEQKLLAALSYFELLFLIPLLVSKDSFVRYHVNQGILLFIASIIVGIASSILAFIPYIGGIIGSILGIALFVLFLIGLINAINGEEKPLPIIGSLFTIIK